MVPSHGAGTGPGHISFLLHQGKQELTPSTERALAQKSAAPGAPQTSFPDNQRDPRTFSTGTLSGRWGEIRLPHRSRRRRKCQGHVLRLGSRQGKQIFLNNSNGLLLGLIVCPGCRGVLPARPGYRVLSSYVGSTCRCLGYVPFMLMFQSWALHAHAAHGLCLHNGQQEDRLCSP